MKERTRYPISGGLMLLVGLALLAATPYFVYLLSNAANAHQAAGRAASPNPALVLGVILSPLAGLFVIKGLFVQGPNEARVLQFFGRYIGTVRTEGLRWTNPLNSKTQISLKVRNFESARMKVNDVEGNPIEIAAIVVWRVVDTAAALFAVENYQHFVQVQAEAAVRNLATHHPYDAHEEGQLSLRGNSDQIAAHLADEIAARLQAAGVEIVEARIAHLAYAPEIAQAMLQRQQAGAIIAARTRIVEGAVSMVEMALQQLSSRGWWSSPRAQGGDGVEPARRPGAASAARSRWSTPAPPTERARRGAPPPHRLLAAGLAAAGLDDVVGGRRVEVDRRRIAVVDDALGHRAHLVGGLGRLLHPLGRDLVGGGHVHHGQAQRVVDAQLVLSWTR
ncbi:MAG: SPFH domain-containing protein [Kofleriaceae bacterium]